MNPDRQAMIDGWKSPPQRKANSNRDGDARRDVTGPRFDPANRISKPTRKRPGNQANPAVYNAGTGPPRYMTQDEQEERNAADEDNFVLKQSKKKADIRVREGRAEPIDNLAFAIRFIDANRDILDDQEGDEEISVPSPEAVLQGLNEAQLQNLENDIQAYHTLESDQKNREYWEALLDLCADRRQKLRPQDPEGRTVNEVVTDVDKIFAPKTLAQLEALEKDIKAKLNSDEPIDTDYWGELLKILRVYKAKAKVKAVFEAAKAARVELLKTSNPELAEILQNSDGSTGATSAPAGGSAKSATRPATSTTKAPVPAAAGSSSDDPPPGTARFSATNNEDFSQATKALYDREVARGIGEGEEIFAAEEAVPGVSKPAWADKYRPRKPRYFNRVQMGYEWNKYNQTHYDHDNPPPKVVQGYRFNIFYPDLIDKTKAPTFKIIREHGRRRGESSAPAGKEDTCLIRFIAGPPYQDIAFRIVDKEWDYSAKRERGFKSSFDKGILQLHFQFKKIYYRK